jgi:hypothetical protein
MKKLSVICSAVVLSVVFMLVSSPLSLASADTVGIESLKATIPQEAFLEASEAAPVVYQDAVLGLLPTNTEGGEGSMLLSSFTYDELTGATFSNPIPVFASSVKYGRDDEFVSKLKLVGWDVVARIGETPICVFTMSEHNGWYGYDYAIGQGYATNYAVAMERLGTEAAASLPVGVHQFLVDVDDRVTLVNPLFDDTEYPLTTFDELNSAATQQIIYFADIPEEQWELGGGPLLDFLYGEAPLVQDAKNQPNIVSLGLLVSGGVVVLLGVLYFISKKTRKPDK